MSEEPGPSTAETLNRRDVRVAGAMGAAVALSAMWVMTSIASSARFVPAALGDLLVRAAPGDLATFFIESLDHWALRILVGVLLIGSILAGGEILWKTASRKVPLFASAGASAAVAGIAVVVFAPEAGSSKVASGAVVAIGALVYALTSDLVFRSVAAPVDRARRSTFRLAASGAGALAFAGGVAGWLLQRLSGPNTDVVLVEPQTPAAIPKRLDFPQVPGLTPEITATEDHYVVDINLFSPSVEAEGWALNVDGLVDHPLELSFSELQDRFEVVEEYSVLVCVSNEVGGNLVGNSAWGGVRLGDVLDEAGVDGRAVDVVFTGADGYTDSIPIEAAMAPTTLLAVSQNGAPLQQDHGFPCRVRVPSIYGMKNVKWLESIEVVGRDYNGYWAERGWSDEAVIKTQSRIDVPGDGESVSPGDRTWVAGIAWAGDRGVQRVEVSIDGGQSWDEAMVKDPVAPNAWQQWAYEWTPSGGGETKIMCRATDGEGRIQTEREAPPHPAGASGWHTIDVSIA